MERNLPVQIRTELVPVEASGREFSILIEIVPPKLDLRDFVLVYEHGEHVLLNCSLVIEARDEHLRTIPLG